MNSAGFPTETVPLQGKYEGFHGQPGGSAGVQYTTVSVPPEPPKDHIIWSLCCFLHPWHPCCCLGLAALIFSIKVSFIHGKYSAWQRIVKKEFNIILPSQLTALIKERLQRCIASFCRQKRNIPHLVHDKNHSEELGDNTS